MFYCLIRQLFNLFEKFTFTIQQPSRITLWIWNLTFLKENAFQDTQDPLLSSTDTDRACTKASKIKKGIIHFIYFWHFETEAEVAARALKI